MRVHGAGGLVVHCLVVGDLMTNSYVLTAQDPAEVDDPPRSCWVVDPGLTPQPLLSFLQRKGLSVQQILLTHGHGDHIAGAGAVQHAHPAAVLTAPAGDAGMLSDPLANMSMLFGVAITAPAPGLLVRPGDELTQGPLCWRVLDTSGHTPGGVSYYCRQAEAVLTGDALFAESIGRTDIPGASGERLVENIRRNLLVLPDPTRVLPGHGPTTTIGDERRGNPFLGQGR